MSTTEPTLTAPPTFAEVADRLIDPREAIARAFELAATTVAAVTPDQLANPTPSMPVELLLGHLIMVGQRVAAAGRGEPPATWPMETTGLAPDEWAPAFRAEIGPALDAWRDDATLVRPTALPWDPSVPGADVVAMYTSELTVHTWDLAQGTGQEPAWDHEVLEVADAIMRIMLPMADRTPMWEGAKAALPPEVVWDGDPFANAVPIDDETPLLDRHLAWVGRQP